MLYAVKRRLGDEIIAMQSGWRFEDVNTHLPFSCILLTSHIGIIRVLELDRLSAGRLQKERQRIGSVL